MIIIIVLGNKLQSNKIHDELKERMNVSINLLQKIDADILILSGGKANPNFLDECKVMNNYAIKKGVSADKIILENRSLDTIGNAFFTAKIVKKLDNIDMIYVSSSCYHMRRTEYIFKKTFGSKYNFNFNFCCKGFDDEKELEEIKKFEINKNFFAGIQSGDLLKIKKRLIENHKLYNNNF